MLVGTKIIIIIFIIIIITVLMNILCVGDNVTDDGVDGTADRGGY